MNSLPEAGNDAPGPDSADMRSEIARHLPSLFGLAVALTGDRLSAEDLLQSAAVRVFASEAEIQSLNAYIRRTIINLHADGLRRLKVERVFAAREARNARTLEDPTGSSECRMDIGRALAVLPQLIRTILVLRFLEDLTAEEIGRSLHKPAGTIRRLTHEGVVALRSSGLLDDYGSGFVNA